MSEKRLVDYASERVDFEKIFQRAFANRISMDDYEESSEMSSQEVRRIFAGEEPFDRERYNQQLIDDENNPAIVIINDPHQYFALLHYIANVYGTEGSMDAIYSTVEHETQHYWAAIEEGLQPRLCFFFVGEGGFQAFTSLGSIPKNMTDEQFVHAAKKVTSAPHRLSDSDKTELGLE